MTCKWQVEIDDYCRKVLNKHWPGVKKYEDIKELSGKELEAVDLISGGFPCQDISVAGRGDGIEGERSSLWFEMLRIIRVVQPRYVLVENVPALRYRGLDTVLKGLAVCGYNAEWNIISAASVGARHRRDRMFIVAHSLNERCALGQDEKQPAKGGQLAQRNTSTESTLAYTNGELQGYGNDGDEKIFGNGAKNRLQESAIQNSQGEGMADSEGAKQKPTVFTQRGRDGLADFRSRNRDGIWRIDPADLPNTNEGEQSRGSRHRVDGGKRCKGKTESGWERTSNNGSVKSHVGRVASRIPARVDRLRALGNAVVPQVAEYIGRLIVEFDRNSV